MNDLRQELEARSLSTKGLKSQLVQRLELALRKEKDADAESSSDSSFLSKFINDQTDVKLDSDLKVVDEVKTVEEIREKDNEIETAVLKDDEVPNVSFFFSGFYFETVRTIFTFIASNCCRWTVRR